jgi:hypothetical protein
MQYKGRRQIEKCQEVQNMRVVNSSVAFARILSVNFVNDTSNVSFLRSVTYASVGCVTLVQLNDNVITENPVAGFKLAKKDSPVPSASRNSYNSLCNVVVIASSLRDANEIKLLD